MEMNCEFYVDVGFQEGAVEVPAIGHSEIEQTGYTYEHVHPAKGRIFENIRIQEHFETARLFNYVKVTMVNNTDDPALGVEQVYYGWVDRVEMVSDNATAPIVEITWHVDLWRTWANKAEFGYGMVVNRPNDITRPEQSFDYILKNKTEIQKIGSLDTVVGYDASGNAIACYRLWVILSYVYESSSSEDTQVVHSVFPLLIRKDNNTPLSGMGQIYYNNSYSSSNNKVAVSFDAIANGTFLHTLGISPTSVTGCWLSAYCPYKVTYAYYAPNVSGYVAGYHYFLSDSNDGALSTNKNKYFNNPVTETETLTDVLKTTETEKYVINDFTNNTIFEASFGQEFSSINRRMNISPTTCSMDIWLGDDMESAKTKGLFFSMNLPDYPLASNSWSDYVISGQKEAIREQRRIAQWSSLGSGLLGAGSAGIEGYGMGSINPKTASMAGSIGAIGAGLGVASAVGGFAIQGWANDKLNQVSDYLAGRQIDTLSLDSGSSEWYRQTQGVLSLVKVSYDSYSIQQFQKRIELNGVTVSEPTSDCTELCQGTGPVRIENLIVTGPIPAEARAYIKQRFNDGVRLI